MFDIQSIQIEPLNNAKQVYIAVSGGIDSIVLLHIIANANLQCPITVVHVNHGLCDQSVDWAERVKQQAAQYQYDVIVHTITEEKPKANIEAWARQKRYQFFESILQAQDVLLLGHHANDQLETLLLRLMRGTGLDGLTGMPKWRSLGLGKLYRPLLSLTREMIVAYAKKYQLSWIDDPSNTSMQFDRNYLRAHVVPSLVAQWPQSVKHIERTTILLNHDNTALELYRSKRLETLCDKNQLQWSGLMSDSLAEQIALFRHWLLGYQHHSPDQKHLTQSWAMLTTVNEDAAPIAHFEQGIVTRYRNYLYWYDHNEWTIIQNFSKYNWHYDQQAWDQLSKPQCMPVFFKPSQNYLDGIDKPEAIILRRIHNNERFHSHDRKHSQIIKKLWQEWGVPPWFRPVIPGVEYDSKLVAIGIK